MNDILLELRHADAAPSYIADIIHDAGAVGHIMVRAADEIERLRAMTVALESDLVAARNDTKRLDWIEAHPEIGLGSSRPHVRIVGLSLCDEKGFRMLEYRAEAYRTALDAAMGENP